MRELIKPERLRPGDKVAVVSLSSGMLGEPRFIHKYELAKRRMEADWGLRVVPMPNALRGTKYLYERPEARARDLMKAFRDPEIKAVFSAIGGDDTIRLLPYIDFDVLRKNPKIFTGFSDTTTNHMMMQKAGLVSYYGLSLMCNWAEYGAINEYTAAAIRDTLFEPKPELDIPCSDFFACEEDYIRWNEADMDRHTPRFPNAGYEIIQGRGAVTGHLLGGCVDVFMELTGTCLWPDLEDWRGALLLLETSEEDMSTDLLTWALRNLAAQGVFNVISGVVVGHPDYRDKVEPYREVLKKVIGFEAGRPDLPILYNVNVGHAYPIGLLPLGLRYEIDCDRGTFRLLEPATR